LAVAVIALAVGVLLGITANAALGQDAGAQAVIVLYEDGHWEYAQSATGTPSATPEATQTPQAQATPTHPPTVTAGPTLNPSPTPEPMTPVPSPSITPTAAPKGCIGRVYNGPGLSLRTGHTTTSPAIRVLADGTSVTITGFYVYSDAANEWAHVTTADGVTGWLAAYFYTPPKRLLLWNEDEPGCYPPYVEIERPNTPTATPFVTSTPAAVVNTTAGLHLLFDTAPSNVATVQPVIGTIKTTSGAEPLGRAFKQANPGVVWVHRNLFVCGEMRDGPKVYEWFDPSLYVRCIEDTWNTGADYYEFVNEVGFAWDVFADFSIYVMSVAGDRGVCLLWGSFAAGNPDYAAWAELARVLDWVDTHPCGTDRFGRPLYHGLALHMPLMIAPGIPLNGRGAWAVEPHVAQRYRYIDAELVKLTGVHLWEHRGGLWVTEAGLDDGYSGSWADDWSCDELARSFWYTIRQLQASGFGFQGVYLWTFGDGDSIWTDRQTCAGDLLRTAG